MRQAIILDGKVPVNVIVIPDGPEGDAFLNETCIEITGLEPPPGVDCGWSYVNNQWVAPVPPPLTYEQVENIRKVAYIDQSDPVFFQWQRGTATEQDWLDAVQAVKDAHPYPPQPTP